MASAAVMPLDLAPALEPGRLEFAGALVAAGWRPATGPADAAGAPARLLTSAAVLVPCTRAPQARRRAGPGVLCG
jgi:hypothetical protein